MINDMKLGMRLLRYTYGIKMNMTFLVFLVAGDILCFALELMRVEVDYTGVGGYLLLVVGMLPVQLLFSLNIVSAVLSSPLRKRLQTSVPTVMSFLGMAGAIMEYGFFLLFYKKPVSKRTMGVQAMKEI